jgi:hypothetical protein
MAQGKVEEALRALLAISPARTRASVIAQIANRIGPGRKRAVAINLLEQARAMLGESPQADNQDEMNALLEIAAAFSQYDSKRSFDIVEPLVDQFNEISDAARKLSGFGMEVSQEGELVMYNGNVVVATGSQITKSLATLATIDIDRAKSAADRLQAPEVRLLAYLGIARQVLTPQNGSVWFGY